MANFLRLLGRRLAALPLMILGVTLLVFVVLQFAPGDRAVAARSLDRGFAALAQARAAFAPAFVPREVGAITQVTTGIARVSGLPGAGFDELLAFPGGLTGIAFNVDENELGVVLLGAYWHLRAGDEAGFPEKANFVGLKEKGQLTSATDAAARVLAYLGRADFGASAVADVRDT